MNTLGLIDLHGPAPGRASAAAAGSLSVSNSGVCIAFIVQGETWVEVPSGANKTVPVVAGQPYALEIHPPPTGAGREPWDITMKSSTPGMLVYREGDSDGYEQQSTRGWLAPEDPVRTRNYVLQSPTSVPPPPNGQLPPPPANGQIDTGFLMQLLLGAGVLVGLAFVFFPKALKFK